MNSVSLRQLEYFATAAEKGTITAAAQALHVSPGGVSVAISELESGLGVQLTLRRRAKGVALTPAGHRVLERARSILAETDELQDIARAMHGELTGTLRIGCFPTLSPWALPPTVAHLSEQHPALHVELLEASSDELQQQLHEGELDLCLMFANHIRTPLDTVTILPVRPQIVLAPSHQLAAHRQVALHELDGEPAILLSLAPTPDLVENILHSAGFEPNIRWRSTNVETIRSMVARGLGYTITMGRPTGTRTYDDLPLVYKPISDDIPDNAVVIAYPQGTAPTAKMQAVINYCAEAFHSGETAGSVG